MNYKFIYGLFLFFIAQFISVAQNGSKKGTVYFFWGYNRSAYSKSDIHFRGNDYDFTLKDVKAKDRPTPFKTSIYFNPKLLTIPQYNFRIGYYLNDHISVSVGEDHMKYVMVQNQTCELDGNVSPDLSPVYQGTYNHKQQTVTEEFLTYEHTDGLNFIFAEIGYSKPWADKTHYAIEPSAGIKSGFIYPKSNVKLMTRDRHDDFNVAGFGVAVRCGVKFIFMKHLFFIFDLNAGYIDLPNVKTSFVSSDKASQRFLFLEGYGGIGLNIPTMNKKTNNTETR